MKILVIDDNEVNRNAAKAQLAEHDLTVVEGYTEAQGLLGFDTYFGDTTKHNYDVVLADLLMPASDQHQASNRLVGQEMPIGIFLALLAAKNGAKHVAVFTDSDHHSHPASACFDAFNPRFEDRPSPMTVGEAQMMLVNNRNWVNYFQPNDLSKEMSWQEAEEKSSVRAKSWGKLLEYLVNYSEEEQIEIDEENKSMKCDKRFLRFE